MKTLKIALSILVIAGSLAACKKDQTLSPIGGNRVSSLQIASSKLLIGKLSRLLEIDGRGFNAVAAKNLVTVNGEKSTVISASTGKLLVSVSRHFRKGSFEVDNTEDSIAPVRGTFDLNADNVQVSTYFDNPEAPNNFTNLKAIALDSLGNIFAVADEFTIVKIGQDLSIQYLSNYQTFRDNKSAYNPVSLIVDPKGGLYVITNYQVFHIESDGTNIRSVAGANLIGSTDGNGSLATFGSIVGSTLGPDGNIFVTDRGKVRMVTPAGDVSTLSTTTLTDLKAITFATDGGLYVANSFSVNKFIPSNGTFQLVAGSLTTGGFQDGDLISSLFRGISSMTSKDSILFIAESLNNRVRALNLSNGTVTTIAGSSTELVTTDGGNPEFGQMPNGYAQGYADGIGSEALFAAPSSLAFGPDQSLYVGENGYNGNKRIRKLVLPIISTGFNQEQLVSFALNGKFLNKLR